MEDVALGTKIFKRPTDLKRLLQSVPKEKIDHIYIADDSKGNLVEKVVDTDIEIELSIINLEYDAGNGYARREIVEALEEDYLLMVDADHTIPTNIDTLYNQLKDQNKIGGVAGSVAEPDLNRMWQSGKIFCETNGGLIRTSEGDHTLTMIQEEPFVKFDFVPQAILFKRECLEDYSWDRKYTTHREHIDFFVGHWKRTDWEFGVSPGVIFGHHPGGSNDYTEHRHSVSKQKADTEYFLNKWYYDYLKMRDAYWFTTDCTGLNIEQKIKDLYAQEGIVGLVKNGIMISNRILR